MTAPRAGTGAWSGLLDASRPERDRLRTLVVRAVEDLARGTALGAAALGTCSVMPSAAGLAPTTTSERGE